MTSTVPASASALPASAPRPDDVLVDWLAEAGAGDTSLHPRLLRLTDGRVLPLNVDRWAGPVTAGDLSLLRRSEGPVLDVGCGPGRLTAALHRRGADVLGIEVLDQLPVLARRASAPVHVGDIFSPLPREGEWRTILLADGNVGIGGDAVRLLTRLRALLADGGGILCELHPGLDLPPDAAAGALVRLEGLGCASGWFRWALLGAAELPTVAERAGLTVSERWSADRREFAALRPA